MKKKTKINSKSANDTNPLLCDVNYTQDFIEEPLFFELPIVKFLLSTPFLLFLSILSLLCSIYL